MTYGFSPKAVLAFFYPLIASVVASVGSWIVTGDFSDAEIRTAVAGLGTSALAALGAYIGQPGNVQTVVDEPGSDALLPPEALARLAEEPVAPTMGGTMTSGHNQD